MAASAGQGSLGVIHRRIRTPCRVSSISMAIITRSAACRRNVGAWREVSRTQHRGAVLVGSAVAGRATSRGSRVIRVVLAACPGRRRNAADRRRQRGGMAHIAGTTVRNMRMPAPQRGIGRGNTTVVAGCA